VWAFLGLGIIVPFSCALCAAIILYFDTANGIASSSFMKQNNLTPEDAVKWQLWRKATDNQ
jgi:hypothetical protein